MTLEEWSKTAGVEAQVRTHLLSGSKYVVSATPSPLNHHHTWSLYHLEDYTVSSVCGYVIWLVPRTKSAMKRNERKEKR